MANLDQHCNLEIVNWYEENQTIPLVGMCLACKVTFHAEQSLDGDENHGIIFRRFVKHVDETRKKAGLPPMDW